MLTGYLQVNTATELHWFRDCGADLEVGSPAWRSALRPGGRLSGPAPARPGIKCRGR